MNSRAAMNDTLPPLDPQTIAERVGAGMFAEDAASRALGMSVEAMGPGYARLSMSVRPDMLNGFKICHGGFIATLADSAFAFACNSANRLNVAAAITVDFIAPAREGDRLTAEARELSITGRTGIYDVKVVNQAGETIALLRGRSHRLKDKQVVPL
jgi:acyl-CoA thioesterase